MSEPTLGEVLRRLDEVARQMTTLSLQLVEDRREAAATFVRRDVYEARTESLTRDVSDLKADADAKEKTAAETRRQFVFLVLGIAIPAILGLLLAVTNFLSTSGVTVP